MVVRFKKTFVARNHWRLGCLSEGCTLTLYQLGRRHQVTPMVITNSLLPLCLTSITLVLRFRLTVLSG